VRSQRSWRRALARRPKHHSGLEVDVKSCIISSRSSYTVLGGGNPNPPLSRLGQMMLFYVSGETNVGLIWVTLV
jgi:hypothetical protein